MDLVELYKKKMNFPLNRQNNIEDDFQHYLSRILKMLAGCMALSSFTAYLTAKYISLLNLPILLLPPSAFISNISVVSLFSFLVLLVVSFVADDGQSKLNLNRPKEGLFLFSVLFGIFLGSILEEYIPAFLIVYLSGASFFLILGLYKRRFKQEKDSLESFIFGKYVIIFIAILFKILTGVSFIGIVFTIIGVLLLAFIYSECTFGLEETYDYYKKDKSSNELNYIGVFKLYNAFFRSIWILPRYYYPWVREEELIKVPKNKKVDMEVEETPEREQQISSHSSQELLTKYIETNKSAYTEKNIRNLP